MPAKYSHRYAYEQITNTGRNTWKRMEPPKTIEQRIFGYEVDTTTFKKYNHQNYLIGCVFCDLAAVERWATDPDRAVKYPESAAEARQIMNQIVAEITGKDTKSMKTPRTSADFIDALAKIYAEFRTAYEAQQNKLTQARDWMEATQKEAHAFNCPNRQIAELRYHAAKAEWQLAEDDTRKEVMNIRDRFSTKVRELREQFESYLDEHYSVSPDKLDVATMQLLNSGICTASELARLAERHKDNPTMLRMVAAHAEKITDERNQSRADYLTCRKVAFVAAAAKDGGREMNIFDSAASAAERGLQQDSTIAGKMHNHIVGWFDSFRAQMDDVPNAPAETSVGADQRRQDRQAAADKALADALAKAHGEGKEDPERATYIQE